MAARQLALLMAALAWFADALGEPTIDAQPRSRVVEILPAAGR